MKTAVDKLDSRLFELSIRIVTANSSAFFGVGIALLIAAIAFAESGGFLEMRKVAPFLLEAFPRLS